MKTELTRLLVPSLLMISSLVQAAEPERLWTGIWGTSDAEQGYALAVDSAGHAYVTGYTMGELGGAPPVVAESVFLSKHDLDGTPIWSRVWSSPIYAAGRAVVTDPDGSVWIAGQTWGDLAGVPEIGNSDLFLMHVSSDGTLESTAIWGSTGSDAGFGLARDAAGDLYVTGFARTGFDGLPPASSREICVTRLRPDGTRLWTQLRGSSQSDEGRDVAVDADGNVYVCGFVQGAVDGQTFAGSRDICLVKYSADGVWQWTRLWGGSGIDEGQALAVDGDGNVWLAGLGGSFNGQTDVGDSDAFLLKVNPDGAVVWTRLWGSIWADAAYDVAVAGDGLIYTVGLASSATFDGLPGPGGHFLTCFDADGGKQWTQCWGGSDGGVYGVALTGNNALWTVGTTVSGFDGQPAIGQEDFWLSRWGLSTPLSRLTLRGGDWPFELGMDTTEDVDRVEIEMDGRHLGTLYGPLFRMDITPGDVGSDPFLFLDDHRILATAYRSDGTLTAQVETDWRALHEGLDTSIVIESPWDGYTLYTTNTVAPADTLVLQARALVRGPHPRRDELTWLPADTVEFSVGGAVAGTSTNGLPFDRSLHEVEFPTAGLALGEHVVQARLVVPEGYRRASATRRFTVEQRQPELRLSRDVIQMTNYFEVTVVIENIGSAPATLRQLVETMTGFQACRFESAAFGVSPVATDVAWSFTHDTRQGSLTWDLGGFVLPTGAPLNRVTLTYAAVPILFPTDCDYVFGGAGSIEVLDGSGTPRREEYLETTRVIGFGSHRRHLSEAVADALGRSDYLLATHPLNLESAFGVDGLNSILLPMAELATWRGGVLGFHHGTGLFYSGFRNGDLFAVGDLFVRDQHVRDELYVGDLSGNRIRAYSESGELTLGGGQMPLAIDLRSGDGLAMGNVRTDILGNTNLHTRPEIVVAWGTDHDWFDEWGRLTVFQFEHDPALTNQFTAHRLASDFETGDALAVGEAWDDPLHPLREEIIYADADGAFVVLTGMGASVARRACGFGPNDLFAVGDLLGAGFVEVVVGDTDDNELVIYTPTAFEADGRPIYDVIARVPVELSTEDSLAIGDVIGDGFAEIIVTDASRGRVTIHAYEPWGMGFTVVGDFARDWRTGDALAAGYVGAIDKARILQLHGERWRERYAGAIELIHYTGEDLVGSSRSLQSEIEYGGRWADRLATNWWEDGYLLLVGENEILPAGSRTWDLWPSGDHAVDYTDSVYAETDPPTRADDLPELSVGRIAGNSADRIVRALRNAVEVAQDPWRLNTSNAYCVSGSDDDDEFRFVPGRESIAAILRDRGFATVAEHHTPSETAFRDTARSEDLIFLTGHGSPHTWASPTVTWSNIFHHFDPELVRPVVYAASCETGRYPDSGWTLAEMFLWKGAAAYIGATEISYSAGSVGWNRRLAEAFVRGLESGRPIGRSLTLAKRARIESGGHPWDPSRNRYHGDVYHFYGDPKLEIEWPPPSPFGPAGDEGDSGSPIVQGPVSQLTVTVPEYTVRSANGLDFVGIPGGDDLLIPDEPIVPFTSVRVHFPKGTRVQSVAQEQRGGLAQRSGLALPWCAPLIDGHGNLRPAQSQDGWWPDTDFRWYVNENDDGSTTLVILIYAFRYHADNREAEFYADHVFAVDYVESSVEITRLSTDRSAYSADATVQIQLELKHGHAEPLDLAAHARILAHDGSVIETLPSRALRGVKTVASVGWRWTPEQTPLGDLELVAEVTASQGSLYDEARTALRFSVPEARIRSVEVAPRDFRVGESVRVSGILDNTGTGPFDGTVILLLQDAHGILVAELRKDFVSLAADDSFAFEAFWEATVSPRDCRVIVYAQYAGRTTALTVGADWLDAPLLWDTITLADGQLLLSWPSVAGRRYNLLFAPGLGVQLFELIASDLAATPPRNTYPVAAEFSKGFFLLVEQ